MSFPPFGSFASRFLSLERASNGVTKEIDNLHGSICRARAASLVWVLGVRLISALWVVCFEIREEPNCTIDRVQSDFSEILQILGSVFCLRLSQIFRANKYFWRFLLKWSRYCTEKFVIDNGEATLGQVFYRPYVPQVQNQNSSWRCYTLSRRTKSELVHCNGQRRCSIHVFLETAEYINNCKTVQIKYQADPGTGTYEFVKVWDRSECTVHRKFISRDEKTNCNNYCNTTRCTCHLLASTVQKFFYIPPDF